MLTQENRQIWEGLTAYANSEGIDAIDIDNVRRLVLACAPAPARTAPLGFLGTLRETDLKKEAAEFHKPVRSLLLWLSCDKKSRDLYRSDALSFLYDHTRPDHIQISVEEDEGYLQSMAGIPDDTYPSPLGIRVLSRNYKDIADPICEFIWTEYQRFRDGKSDRPVPIVVCTNPGCNRLKMPKRTPRRTKGTFCSDACKSANQRQGIPQGEQNDRQWLYRVKQKTGKWQRAIPRVETLQSHFAELKARAENYSQGTKALIGKAESYFVRHSKSR